MKAKLLDPAIVRSGQEALDFTGDIFESHLVAITL